ncbi:sodium/hydrogen exchanger 7-like protein [Leptotrombidium deliense]|uniref:Sodium/hydrogen exchanger n=1 Tax=Leptotrombidium deliense TaxID=299467 RepID=A0A443S736_9ACAR|nr:sodium/hydrogen exchanger 7-like protein [Leptotrombidium deliense]
MTEILKMWKSWYFVSLLMFGVESVAGYAPVDIKLDEKARQLHKIDTLNILAYTMLLILTVLTIWLFKRRRARYLHETGLAIFYGLIIGAVIRYVGDSQAEYSLLRVKPVYDTHNNKSMASNIPPDSVSVPLTIADKNRNRTSNNTYLYVFRGELVNYAQGAGSQYISQKATFDPEIFFNIILPPIILNAGYSLKRRFFFRNLGAIMTYAFIGTTISCFAVAIILYALMVMMPSYGFNFTDCLYFGAIISATDPVTVLAIFTDLHVDVTLYALVFGESILNDAVAIVLAGSVDKFESHYQYGSGMNVFASTGKAITNFMYIFSTSFFLGSFVGCFTALLTKFTRLCDFPLLESCLFVLMSYSAFLISEVLELSGIVAVLFCGICQAHYTYNNLSDESRARTKQLFELLNFLAENFIFTYLGVSMFTYPAHKWVFGFILVAFLAIVVGRALHVYPLSFILNFGRHNKIPLNYQHVLFFSGLRGAMAYALAIRNTLSEPRRIMLTTTSVISIVTVIVFGGSTSSLLSLLGIPVGVEESEHEMLPFSDMKRTGSVTTPTDLQSPTSPPSQQQTRSPYEKAWLVRKWYNFDVRFMKPLLTHSRPTLIDTLPDCCLPISRLLTTTQQLSNEGTFTKRNGEEFESEDDYVLQNESQLGSVSSSYNGVATRSISDRQAGFGTDDRGVPTPSRVRGKRDYCDYLDDECLNHKRKKQACLPTIAGSTSNTQPATAMLESDVGLNNPLYEQRIESEVATLSTTNITRHYECTPFAVKLSGDLGDHV